METKQELVLCNPNSKLVLEDYSTSDTLPEWTETLPTEEEIAEWKKRSDRRWAVADAVSESRKFWYPAGLLLASFFL
jgi:hypothetical protein